MSVTEEPSAEKPMDRWRIFLQSLCPMLFSCGVFALALSVAPQQFAIASIVMLSTMLMQGLYSSILNTRSVIDRARLQEQERLLLNANAQLSELSLVDHLTGISNRRHLAQALDREWERAARHDEWLAVVMIDVDYFKGVNDRHGHAYGDDCLCALAQMLGTCNRGMDFSARYGGEEFIMLLPNTTAAGAYTVAQRLHNALRERNLPNEASPEHRITISVGIASVQVRRGTDSALLLQAADLALYEAKDSGRNQTCVAPPTPELLIVAADVPTHRPFSPRKNS